MLLEQGVTVVNNINKFIRYMYKWLLISDALNNKGLVKKKNKYVKVIKDLSSSMN